MTSSPVVTFEYHMEPAPRANPRGSLMGAWIVRRVTLHDGRVISQYADIAARFPADGRDAAEEWLLKRGLVRNGRGIWTKTAIPPRQEG